MYRVTRCPCCQADALETWPALVSPFVSEFALGAPVERCKLLECRGCRFRFFDVRYTEAEATKLYEHYRGPHYFEVRHRHEPWYTARFNAAVAGDARLSGLRRQRVAAYLRRHLRWSDIETVLDYGGDDGSALPEDLGRARFVYDLSDVEPVPGVHKLADASALEAAHYDLVTLAHVLEHVADPAALLRRAAQLVRPGSGTLFVEVPFERPRLDALGRGPWTERYLDGLRRHPLALRAVDFVSTAARVKLGVLPPLGLMRAHEHINFFGEESLASLARSADCSVLHMERTPFAPPSDRLPVLVALLRTNAAAQRPARPSQTVRGD